MDGSISRLGSLIGAGAVYSALRPQVTVRTSRVNTLSNQLQVTRALLSGGSATTLSALGELAESFADVQAAALRLSSLREGNVFAARAVESDNPNAVSGTAQPGVARRELTVQVTALAQAQMNLSSSLSPTATTALVPGANTFTITTGGTSRSFSFELSSASTNLETVTSIAGRINAAAFGVVASVRQTATTVQLELRALATGTEASFTIADATGNAVTALSADRVVVRAGDAGVLVDGAGVSASTNSVPIEGGDLTLQLSATTPEPVRVAVVSDVQAIVEGAKNLADKLNALADQIEDGGSLSARRASTALVEPIRRRAAALERIGVLLGKSGRLQIDAERLARAIQSGPERVESLLGGDDGIATVLAAALQDLARGPVGRGAKVLAPSLGRDVFRTLDGSTTGLTVNVAA